MLNEWLKVKNMSSEGRSLGFICQAMGGLRNVTPDPNCIIVVKTLAGAR